MNFSTWTAKLNKLKHMKGQDWLIVILLGVLLLIVAIPSGTLQKSDSSDEGQEKESESVGEGDSGSQEEADYVKNMEGELEDILESMQGVGEVKVMITLKDEGESILDKDVSLEEKVKKENTVIYNKGNDTHPYVTKENVPQIEGVLIVAEGGGNVETVTKISDSVVALFPVEVHKVKVIPMKK